MGITKKPINTQTRREILKMLIKLKSYFLLFFTPTSFRNTYIQLHFTSPQKIIYILFDVPLNST